MECLPGTIKERRKIPYYEKCTAILWASIFRSTYGTLTNAFKQKKVRRTDASNGRERVNFIYDRFAHARPVTNVSAPPRCDFEEYSAVSDPPTAERQNLRVYPRVSEIVDASAERAFRLACESRLLHKVVPLRRKVFFVGDDQDFCNARFVNSDFARISNSKTILKTRLSSVNLADFEWIERASRTLLAGDSQCFWLLASLLAQLKDDGYRPSDPALSAALASRTTVAAGVTDFITSKCRESYLAHAAC